MTAGRPLLGKTVVVTRPMEQAASLAEPLAHLGATVLLAPTIRIVPRPWDDEVAAVAAGLPAYQLVVFTSANAVRVFLDYFEAPGGSGAASPDQHEMASVRAAEVPTRAAEVPTRAAEVRTRAAAALTAVTVAAVGPATASALEQRGVVCDVVPDDFVAEGLAEALSRRGQAAEGARVLIPSARLARPVLPDALRARGALVDVLTVYDTVAAERLEVSLATIEQADFITFTSGSTAREFAALVSRAAAVDARTGPTADTAPAARLAPTADTAPAARTPPAPNAARTPPAPDAARTPLAAAGAAGRTLAERLAGVSLCSIGPQTSEALRELSLPVAVEASEHTSAGLVTAIVGSVSGMA